MWPFRKKPGFRAATDTVHFTAHDRDRALLATAVELAATQPVILAFVFPGTMDNYAESLSDQGVHFSRASNPVTASSVETTTRALRSGLLLLDSAQLKPVAPDTAPVTQLDVPARPDLAMIAPQRYPYDDRNARIFSLAAALNHAFRCTLSFYPALDEPPMNLFAGQTTISILQKQGMKPGDSIQHPFLAKSIERAQQKIAKKCATDPAPHARTAADWYAAAKHSLL